MRRLPMINGQLPDQRFKIGENKKGKITLTPICLNCGERLRKTTIDMTTEAPLYCKVCGLAYNKDGTEWKE